MIEAILTLLAGLVVIAIIIAANGYFVAQEFAYMSVDRTRLGAAAEAGDKSAQRALDVTRRTSFMLSGAQLGITVTGLLVGYVAEPLVGESLGLLLGGAGIPAAISVTIGTVLALCIATIVQMIFGELYPKNLAIANPEPLARALARSTKIYLTVFGWLVTVFDHAANALLRAFRIEPVHDVETTATAKDLERIVADSRQTGDLPEELSVLIDRILDFPERDVEHAMIPRSQVGTVTEATSLGELRELMATGHTRYPVVGHNDEPVGLVQLADLLASTERADATVESIMRETLVIPTLMSLPDAFEQISASGNQLACVVDEYGGFAGVVTIEDLAEELVGELTDEHDDAPADTVTVLGEDEWHMVGDVHLDEVERAIGHSVPEGDYETIAGLLIAERGDLPDAGDVVRIELPADPRDLSSDVAVRRELVLTVQAVERHVPSELLVRLEMSEGADLDLDREGEKR